MITPIYASILTLILICLSMGITNLRKKHHVGLGDGGHEDLIRAIRSHGNFIETAPWGIFLIFLVEYQDGNVYLLHSLGMLLVAGRLLHIHGMKTGRLRTRVAGMMTTFLVFAIAAMVNLFLAFTVGV